MAELSLPYDDVGGDRSYTAGDMADWFDSMLIASGVVFGRENSLNPSNSGTLAISMATGRCFKAGRRYKNTAALSLSLLAVTSGSKRIDRLVVRFDPITARAANATIITGVETTGTPSAPAVVADTDVKIAQILIDNSSGSYAYTVIDERDICLVGNVSDKKFVGEIFEMAGRQSPSSSFPALCMDQDWTFGRSTYPLAYDYLAGQKAKAGSTEDHTVTVTGGVLSQASPTVDWKALVAAISEELTVEGTNRRYMMVNGSLYLITAASTGTYTITCGASGSGSQTATFYPYRTGVNQVTLFKDQGRATMSWDSVLYINGLRRRDRFQGHIQSTKSASGRYPTVGTASSGSGAAANSDTTGPASVTGTYVFTDQFFSDGTNGTPRTGTVTEPNSMTVFRFFWVGIVNT